MKLAKENICVYIEDEPQLEKARGILERYGEKIWDDPSAMLLTIKLNGVNVDFNLLCLSKIGWFLRRRDANRIQITLEQLEEILKGEKDEKM